MSFIRIAGESYYQASRERTIFRALYDGSMRVQWAAMPRAS